jgi:hypothetical protein
MKIVKGGEQWERPAHCESCKAELSVAAHDIQHGQVTASDHLPRVAPNEVWHPEYYFKCPHCQHNNWLVTESLPPHVREEADRRERGSK